EPSTLGAAGGPRAGSGSVCEFGRRVRVVVRPRKPTHHPRARGIVVRRPEADDPWLRGEPTMPKDIFREREMTLEGEYFRKKDFVLLEKLKAVFRKKVDKEGIRKAVGVTDEQLLDRLVDLQLDGELMQAFQLYPLVELAWADGELSEKEAESVRAAGKEQGVLPGTRAYRMLEDRLHKGPDPEVRKIWFLYAEELKKVLSPAELERFRNDILDRARGIVAATGHLERLVLNVGGERKIITAIEKALTP